MHKTEYDVFFHISVPRTGPGVKRFNGRAELHRPLYKHKFSSRAASQYVWSQGP